MCSARIEDKVLIARGNHHGKRGTIVHIDDETARVAITGSAASADVPLTALQNFSLAARKAWHTRPQRHAGRPKDPTLPTKRMVSMRLEVAVWEGLAMAVAAGLIQSREAAVNEWLRSKLEEIWTGHG